MPGGLIVDSGGPTFVRDPIFSPVNVNASPGARVNTNGPALGFPATYNKMSEHDLEAQEALAREFQPALEVSLTLCTTA